MLTPLGPHPSVFSHRGLKLPVAAKKDAPTFTPEWVKTFRVPRGGDGPNINYIVINDVATLAWCANMANLEVHPFLHRIPNIHQPTGVVFDLDSGEHMDVPRAARWRFCCAKPSPA